MLLYVYEQGLENTPQNVDFQGNVGEHSTRLNKTK
jgi:hypothetical protein